MPTTFITPSHGDDDKNDKNDTNGPNPSQKQRRTATRSSRKSSTRFNGRTQGPSFGLVQWQRLVDSSTDLARRGGAPLRTGIPWLEIKSHDRPHDAWVVLKGTVYNLGPYIPYHPGGAEIFKGLLGRDATGAFEKHHPWVSIDGLIGTLAIGTAATRDSVEDDDDSDDDDDDDDDSDDDDDDDDDDDGAQR
eukprot:CAMPEP_0172389156 /NCGR_PEP_ID=MMETSP1061-20121228/6126_1 /TAXON_ID=37318 /ORGANISM="Pseudo-nitzschia pungens, Strain cf. pungens" /LENGTH=190 /DNA_ID=CAMNT_0013119243 /DNA_START=438 /DNA_END=1010 /DNA_ORIENTATION=+